MDLIKKCNIYILIAEKFSLQGIILHYFIYLSEQLLFGMSLQNHKPCSADCYNLECVQLFQGLLGIKVDPFRLGGHRDAITANTCFVAGTLDRSVILP